MNCDAKLFASRFEKTILGNGRKDHEKDPEDRAKNESRRMDSVFLQDRARSRKRIAGQRQGAREVNCNSPHDGCGENGEEGTREARAGKGKREEDRAREEGSARRRYRDQVNQ